MTIQFLRTYGTYVNGDKGNFADDVEAALVAQGFASSLTAPVDTELANTPTPVSIINMGGNLSLAPSSGLQAPTVPQGPRILPNGTILAFASLGTNTTLVAGTLYRCEIFVPFVALWTGIGVLNGATVGTNNGLVALYDSNGVLVANSAVAGAVTAGANAFQQRAFTSPVLLAPGRYFLACQANGTTDTLRTWAAANGGNQMTASSTGTFGTLPASFTPPTTFTADVGPIAHLYQ